LYPAKAPRRGEKMKDNQIGEIKGNSSLKRINSGVDILDRFGLTRSGKDFRILGKYFFMRVLGKLQFDELNDACDRWK
jgi:hypothetical protein